MYLIGTKQQFLSSWGFWGFPQRKVLACREHRTLGKGPSLPHPGGSVGLSEWVCNLGRPILSYPSDTVIGPGWASDSSRATAFPRLVEANRVSFPFKSGAELKCRLGLPATFLA